MKKFKSFHCGIDPTDEHAIPKTAVEWANEWVEENPDAKVLQFRHSLDKDGHDVICVMYEERVKENKSRYIPSPMMSSYDMIRNMTDVECVDCDYHEIHIGKVEFTGPRYCPECARRNSKP